MTDSLAETAQPSPGGNGRRPWSREKKDLSVTQRAEEGLRESLELAASSRLAAIELAGAGDVPADPEIAALTAQAQFTPAHLVAGTRRRLGPAFWAATAWIGLVIFAAIFCNVLPLPNPNSPNIGPPNQGPGLHFFFGTDQIGHDIFSQVVYGARVSMIIGAASVAAGLIIGGGLGVVAGFYRGWVDAVVVWITDALLTLPSLILLLVLVAFLGDSLQNVTFAIALLSIPAYARIARAASLALSQREWVLASLALGSKPRRILMHDIIPLVALPIGSYAAIGASIAILAEGGLAFLGFGSPNMLSWGGLIAAGQQQLQTAPQLTFAPMIVFFVTIIALNYVGQRASGSLDLRQAQI